VPRFDLFRPKRGPGLLLDVQSHWLDTLPSRVVGPLLPPGPTLPAIRDLNPVFEIEGTALALMTHYLTAIPRRELGRPIGSLAAERDAITRALDLLFTRF
jgi:toxin CcdB